MQQCSQYLYTEYSTVNIFLVVGEKKYLISIAPKVLKNQRVHEVCLLDFQLVAPCAVLLPVLVRSSSSSSSYPRLLRADVVHQLLVLHESLLAEVAGAGLAGLVRKEDARGISAAVAAGDRGGGGR